MKMLIKVITEFHLLIPQRNGIYWDQYIKQVNQDIHGNRDSSNVHNNH